MLFFQKIKLYPCSWIQGEWAGEKPAGREMYIQFRCKILKIPSRSTLQSQVLKFSFTNEAHVLISICLSLASYSLIHSEVKGEVAVSLIYNPQTEGQRGEMICPKPKVNGRPKF